MLLGREPGDHGVYIVLIVDPASPGLASVDKIAAVASRLQWVGSWL
jgi:hypothetical protein